LRVVDRVLASIHARAPRLLLVVLRATAPDDHHRRNPRAPGRGRRGPPDARRPVRRRRSPRHGLTPPATLRGALRARTGRPRAPRSRRHAADATALHACASSDARLSRQPRVADAAAGSTRTAIPEIGDYRLSEARALSTNRPRPLTRARAVDASRSGADAELLVGDSCAARTATRETGGALPTTSRGPRHAAPAVPPPGALEDPGVRDESLYHRSPSRIRGRRGRRRRQAAQGAQGDNAMTATELVTRAWLLRLQRRPGGPRKPAGLASRPPSSARRVHRPRACSRRSRRAGAAFDECVERKTASATPIRIPGTSRPLAMEKGSPTAIERYRHAQGSIRRAHSDDAPLREAGGDLGDEGGRARRPAPDVPGVTW
jgi:hypothetical protein